MKDMDKNSFSQYSQYSCYKVSEKYMYVSARQASPYYLLLYTCVDRYKGGLRAPRRVSSPKPYRGKYTLWNTRHFE